MNTVFSSKQIAKTFDLTADLILRQYKSDKMAKFMKIKSINPKLKQSETAKKIKISSSTLQWCRREMNLLSQYRIPPILNTHTRKQMFTNNTEHDLELTSNDHKITSNEPVKSRGKKRR